MRGSHRRAAHSAPRAATLTHCALLVVLADRCLKIKSPTFHPYRPQMRTPFYRQPFSYRVAVRFSHLTKLLVVLGWEAGPCPTSVAVGGLAATWHLCAGRPWLGAAGGARPPCEGGGPARAQTAAADGGANSTRPTLVTLLAVHLFYFNAEGLYNLLLFQFCKFCLNVGHAESAGKMPAGARDPGGHTPLRPGGGPVPAAGVSTGRLRCSRACG